MREVNIEILSISLIANDKLNIIKEISDSFNDNAKI